MTEELRVTMHDEYGRCIHCGFWHKPGTMAEQGCAEHEKRGCMCSWKRLPKPVMGADGLWHSPSEKP